MSERLIFVSASQRSDHKAVGLAVAETIDATSGFRAFFAEEKNDTEPTTDAILEALHQAAGMVVVFQRRFDAEEPGRGSIGRASVWVHEEVGAMMYRIRARKERVPVLGLRESGLYVQEGMLVQTLLKPLPFFEHQGGV